VYSDTCVHCETHLVSRFVLAHALSEDEVYRFLSERVYGCNRGCCEAMEWSKQQGARGSGLFHSLRMRAIKCFVCPSERPSSLRSWSSKTMSVIPHDPAACVCISV
jgi:hypothetical protein